MPKLAELNICTGCTACASICPKGCIVMTVDTHGFLYPEVNTDSCVDCGLCENTCPVLNPSNAKRKLPTAYAAYSTDETLRLASSSGGIFSELARVVLSEGGVVFGAAYNEQFDVVHICAEDEAGLARLRGAKYAQSNLGNTFADIKDRLTCGQQVLFSGTPCQVVGLKSFLRKEHENLITVDFVCHGVPSPMAWQEYVKYRSQQDNCGILPRSINLRSKTTGWSRYTYSNLFEYHNGSTQTVSSGESLFMKLFVGNYISRVSCATCSFKGYSRVSDLTLGDFWGIWDIDPAMDDNKGTSLILCHTPCGKRLLSQISNQLVMKSVTLEHASNQNPALLISSSANTYRNQALSLIRTGNISACADLIHVPETMHVQKFNQNLRRIIKRIIRRT